MDTNAGCSEQKTSPNVSYIDIAFKNPTIHAIWKIERKNGRRIIIK